MNLEEIAALANQHDRWAHESRLLDQRPVDDGEGTPLTLEEHEMIAELARAYLSAMQREGILRDKFAGLAMQGLLAGASVDPTNLISGPQIAITAYDIAGCMMGVRAAPPVQL